jgi:DNA-directed RNA polymerase subunit F
MPKKAVKNNSYKKVSEKSINDIKDIETLSRDELRELLLINTYKLTLTRAQVDAIMEILIKKGITTYDEVWKKTNEIFKENKRD